MTQSPLETLPTSVGRSITPPPPPHILRKPNLITAPGEAGHWTSQIQSTQLFLEDKM
jgi:hypothetical protein